MTSPWIPVTIKYGKNSDGLTTHWLEKNCRGPFKIEDDCGGYRILFKSSKDAAYVLLKWS